jgi:biopolymer transport protein ExbB
MKKFFALLLVAILSVTSYNTVLAQNTPADTNTTKAVTDPNTSANTVNPSTSDPNPPIAQVADADKEEIQGMQLLKKYFIDGGWFFMSFVLVCLILGLAVAIERIITLSLATTNTKKLLLGIEEHVSSGDINGARELCLSTPGPAAEVLGEGLKRTNEGLGAVENAIVANGSVQTGVIEKGLVWLALFIALAPMLGFMGTVLGMIDAFDKIQAAGEIDPAMVAGGIKIALLTTVFGLITAIILQIFYNFITSKVDALVNDMEDASVTLVDILYDNNVTGTNNK